MCSTSLSEGLCCLSIFLSASGECFSGRREYFLNKVLKIARANFALYKEAMLLWLIFANYFGI